jgi:bifunctional non-homologous end joining protein LigD
MSRPAVIASTGISPGRHSYGIEPKLDGWRAIVHVREGSIRVLTRPGRDVTALVPQLVDLVSAVPDVTVLDGELVYGSGSARSFYRVGARLGSTTFAAFDLLAEARTSITRLPYEERRGRLESLNLTGPAWCTLPSWTAIDVRALIAACAENDVEGFVAKRLDASYRPDVRSTAWIKLKTTQWHVIHAPRRHEQPSAVQ